MMTHPTPNTSFFSGAGQYPDGSEHKDVTFVVGPCKEHVKAHKAILVARGEYFRGLFRKGGMRESETGTMVSELRRAR